LKPLSPFLLLILMPWQPAVAQEPSAQESSLPSCTQDIADTDEDGVSAAMDIDKDGDGLIELCSLEGLDAMRYQSDGSGYKASGTATRITTGCPQDGCDGYELVRSLDFNDTNSYDSESISMAWTTGTGWLPIGTFNAVFEGNGHTISNLMIDRSSDDVGLFGYVAGTNAAITNIGLLNVSIKGGSFTGSLVGFNQVSITNSYATSAVIGNLEEAGGLVGFNTIFDGSAGMITNSYATGNVMGGSSVGGLVGKNGENDSSGTITNSYATGAVTGNELVGGLVGDNSGTITNSYATGSNNINLVVSDTGTIMNNRHLSLRELQSPTTATGIYSQWSTADWDFGTETQSPRLKYVVGLDTSYPACDTDRQPSTEQPSTKQPSCGSLLPNQPRDLRARVKVFLEGPLR